MDTFTRDLRYAIRSLIKSPGFTTVAVLTLALGIGASTAIFSVVDAVLLRALPYPEPEKIVRVWEQAPDGHRMNFSDPNFDDFRAQNSTFSEMAAYTFQTAAVSGGNEPVHVNVATVSRDFFKLFAIAPVRGRSFIAEEQQVHGRPAVVVSYGYWQRYLGGASDLSNAKFIFEEKTYSVVGVMPEGFDFPQGSSAWVARELDPAIPSRTAHNGRGLGRLRNGVTITQAKANLASIAQGIRAQFGRTVDLTDAAVVPLSDAMVGDVRTALMTLLAAVGLLLVVACANVAGLLIARNSARRKEFAVRAALGAGRGRLVQQFLAEASVLAIAAGAAGIVIAMWAVQVLPSILPANLPRQKEIAIQSSVLWFAVLTTLAVAVALGLFAAWRAWSGDLRDALTSGSRGNTSGASHRFRGALVIGEIAATLVILAGAGLLARSFLRLVSTDPGFNPRNLVMLEYSLPTLPWGDGSVQPAIAGQSQFSEQVAERIRTIPGVERVAVAGAIPVAAGDNLADGTFVVLAGGKAPATKQEFSQMLAGDKSRLGHASYYVVSDTFFETLGIPLVRGRVFGSQDDLNSTHAAVISQTLALRRWPNQDPIGQTIAFGIDGILKPLTIVGVVGDVRAEGLDHPASAVIYVDYRQRGFHPNSSPTLLIRSRAPAATIATAARAILREAAPAMALKFSSYADEMGGWLADRKFVLLLTGIFAIAALSLAAVGIYGVVSFSVARRTQEIGIRVALGASRSNVLRLIVGEGARLAIGGVAIGIIASLAVTRWLSSLLFGISANDPLTFAIVGVVLGSVALVASYLPARRAMRVDPNVALRDE
jgi:predicted permease